MLRTWQKNPCFSKVGEALGGEILTQLLEEPLVASFHYTNPLFFP